MMAIDITGKRFGRLFVQSRGPNTDRGETRWHCVCDCGTEKLIRGDCLRRGDTKSCGCFAREKRADRKCEKCGQLRERSEFKNRSRICAACKSDSNLRPRRKKASSIEPMIEDAAIRLARMKW